MREQEPEKDMDRFIDKLIGRFITLGCYLFLDMRVEWIHELLKTGKFIFSLEKSESSFSYITRSFFIRDIRHDEPRDHANPIHRNIKQTIFNHLSPHEQDCLKRFIKDTIDEVSYLNWIRESSHIDWLRDDLMKKIWRPE